MIQKPKKCSGCPLFGNGYGYVPVTGSSSKGVLIVAEAPGEEEAKAGTALIGKSGHYLFSNLARVGIERDGVLVHNILSCRPPDNKLVGMPYEKGAISHCSSNINQTISQHTSYCKSNNLTPVIVALGVTAFKSLLDLNDRDPILKEDYLVYPHWSEKHQAFILGSHHPAYLIRGNHHLLPITQFVLKRALEIASNGLKPDTLSYDLDPTPHRFQEWIEEYKDAYRNDPENVFLSYDIETPMKQGANEESVSKEADDDYTILRSSFCWKPGHAVSVPWRAEYKYGLEQLFRHSGSKVGWNSENYDSPRVKAQMPINGDEIDAMLAWHVLNTSLPKGLGFVTPFYAQTSTMWKHLSSDQPAFYNAKDADMALRNWLGIRKDLKENGLWDVFDRHITQLNRVFSYMSGQGVLRDEVKREAAETRVSAELLSYKSRIDCNIPDSIKPLKVYKKTPKSTEGMTRVEGTIQVKQCSTCGVYPVKADHFKSIGKKRLKAGEAENPCVAMVSKVVEISLPLWAKPLEFKLSNKSLQAYQQVVGHKPILTRKERKVTFDEKAILQLLLKYPDDLLYPTILDFRSAQGHLSKYIGTTETTKDGRKWIKGGLTTGRDGVIRTTFTSNPSTLRSAAQNPPLQQLPRAKGPDDIATIIRNLVVARPGHTFVARDFSGIEAVLTGYFACSPEYIRLARLDVHSYYSAYAVYELDKRISANDLPQLSWPDEKLIPHLAGLKKLLKEERNGLYKHLVHAANFMQGPKGAQEKILLETGKVYPVKQVAKVMGIYYDLFPAIKTYHSTIMAQADKDGFLRNPFGYIHRFSRVYEWEKVGGAWQKKPGPDANKCIAFGPQSTAAGMIKEAMLRLYQNRFDEAGHTLRLLIHDELFGEALEAEAERIDLIYQEEMEKPVPELSLPDSYGMGKSLVILTEGKRGTPWGRMC